MSANKDTARKLVPSAIGSAGRIEIQIDPDLIQLALPQKSGITRAERPRVPGHDQTIQTAPVAERKAYLVAAARKRRARCQKEHGKWHPENDMTACYKRVLRPDQIFPEMLSTGGRRP
jgi:hypothetical protein